MDLFLYLVNCALTGVYYDSHNVHNTSLGFVALHAIIAAYFAFRFVRKLAK